jgi:trans-2,3-dihydro-3-hydroxyanthranilate isomerase
MKWITAKMVNTFTDQPFAGNPAWVAYGDDLTNDEQTLIHLANELNPVSDTAFVFPREGDADVFLRFFSKSEEIGFSGHGTIATYHALANESLLTISEPTTLIRQRTKTGTQHIELRVRDGKIHRVTVSLPVPQFISTQLDTKVIARFLGLPPIEILETTFPIGVVGLAGNTDVIVPVNSCDALHNLNMNIPLLKNYCDRMQIKGVVVWCFDGQSEGKKAYMRHFAPSVGIEEDPVSGAAGAEVGCFMVHNKIIPVQEMNRIIVEQGMSMNRPGTVYVHVHTHDTEILKVSFGGQGLVMFEGRLLLTQE